MGAPSSHQQAVTAATESASALPSDRAAHPATTAADCLNSTKPEPQLPRWTAVDGVIFCLVLACWCLAVARFLHKLERLRLGRAPAAPTMKQPQPPMNIEHVHICEEADDTVIYRTYAENSRMSACLAERAARIDCLRREYEQQAAPDDEATDAADAAAAAGAANDTN